jgi:hypothetical protein
VSSANVHLARSICAAWERGDFLRPLEFADPETEIVNVDGLIPVRSTGVRRAEERLRDFMTAWKDFHVEVEEYRELDGERVLVLNTRSGRGKTSGVELQGAKGAELSHVRDGRLMKAIW